MDSPTCPPVFIQIGLRLRRTASTQLLPSGRTPLMLKNKILQAEKHRKHPSAGHLGGHTLPGRTPYAASGDGLCG